MLKLTAIEFILRAIPEGFIFILASYALSGNRIDLKKYIISSLLFGISMYFIRILPINYGVHMILNIIVVTLILIIISKIDIIPAIKASIIAFICLFIIEIGNMLILSFLFKEHVDEMMSNTIIKTMLGLPSLALFSVITIYYYYYSRKRDK